MYRNKVVHILEPDLLYCEVRAEHSTAHIATCAWTVRAARCDIAVESAMPDTNVEILFSLGPFGRHLVRRDDAGASVAPRAAWVVGPHGDSIYLAKETRE